MPEDVSDSILKEATEWHKERQPFESDDKLEKEDKDKIKDFFDNKAEKNISEDKDGRLCVKLKNNERVTYTPTGGIGFGKAKKPSIETMKLALDGYAATGKEKAFFIQSEDSDFIAKSLVAFEECGFECTNIGDFKDNKEIQDLKNKYMQERKDIENKSHPSLSVEEHIRSLSVDGQNQKLAPQEIKPPLKPVQNKDLDPENFSLMKDRIADLKR